MPIRHALHVAEEICYAQPMKRKRPSKRPSRGDSLLHRYREALRSDRAARADAEAFAHIKIAPPAVRPKDVSRAAIRRAVREAMREYVERHESTEST